MKDAGDILGGVIDGVATGAALILERGLGGNESLSGGFSGVIACNGTSEVLSGLGRELGLGWALGLGLIGPLC